MNSKVATTSVMSFFLCCAFLWADMPALESGVKINEGSSPIELGMSTVVDCVDWNNDGAKDLIIGEWVDNSAEAYVWLYLNQGTDLNPIFSGGAKIESNGIPIKTTAC